MKSLDSLSLGRDLLDRRPITLPARLIYEMVQVVRQRSGAGAGIIDDHLHMVSTSGADNGHPCCRAAGPPMVARRDQEGLVRLRDVAVLTCRLRDEFWRAIVTIVENRRDLGEEITTGGRRMVWIVEG